MGRTHRPGALSLLLLTAVALLALPAARAGAQIPPPAGYVAGSGNFEGTESVLEEQFVGAGCGFRNTRTVFALQGAGTYEGVTPAGQPVVYNAQITSGQTLWANGPLHIEVESTETYYHGPNGSYGSDSTCNSANLGAPTTITARIWATDHVYRLDGGGAQIPCVGHGTFARGPGQPWHAQWTLDSDCTVVGNAAGTPGTGLARAGTGFTDQGTHAPCFDTCSDNIEFDYTQYLPFVGLHLGLTGPATNKVNTVATVTANLTDDGQPVAGSAVSFSVSGPAATSPTSASVTTGADGRASFSFIANTVGSFTVTATTPSETPEQLLTATHNVQITPPPPPTVTLSGPAAAQTEEGVRVAATFTNDDIPVQNVQIGFSVSGAGMATPATGSATTDSLGWALFDFSGDRAGDYTVTASTTYAGHFTSDTLTIPLEINTFYREATLTLPTGERAAGAAVINPGGDYAYFAEGSTLVKVNLETFQRVGAISLTGGGSATALVDPTGHYGYFANSSGTSALILKVDLTTFEPVSSLTLPAGERRLRSAVIDPAGHFAYYGASASSTLDPGKVVKIDLDTFQRVGSIALPSDELNPAAALMSPAGDFAYFGAQGAGTLPARLVKVDLATFQRVGSLPMADSSENSITKGSLIDPDGHFAYLPVHQAAGGSSSNPEHIVKVDLTTLSRVASMTLESWSAHFNTVETRLNAAVMDPAGNFAYFGTADTAGREQRVLRVDLRTFEKRLPVTLTDLGHGIRLFTAVIAPDGDHAYFGTANNPGKILKLALNRPPKPALAAADDTYATNYLTPLTVAAPGVLANDVDTEDADPLLAGQASDPAHGSVSLNADGSFTYTPDAGYSGTDTFTYTANDRRDYSAPATVSVTVGGPPQGVQAVDGGACGYYTNVGLFGAPQALRGCGQTADDATGSAPSLNLAPVGSGPVTATKTEGAMALYGPAAIFSGIFPPNGSAPAPSGPLSVATQGATGPGGSATSSASVVLHDTPVPVRCDGDPAGTTNCSSPGGIGPGPVIAEGVHSSCVADQSGVSGSATITNGILETKYDAATQLPIATEAVPVDPPPNYTRSGTLDHVGDSFRVVYNEQILGPDSITVNAVHMYLLGPTAIGDMVVGQSRCAITTDAPDAAPTATDDAYAAIAGHPLVVPAAGVLANDTDADFAPLRASALEAVPPPTTGGGAWAFPSDPAHGTLALGTDGGFTYTADAEFTGTDTFTYLAQDARGHSDQATVTLTVTPAPPTPAPVADFDGDGDTDVSVFRPSDGVWYVHGGATTAWGTDGDIPVPGDYDGDGTTDMAVFRPSTGVWFVQGGPTTAWGTDGDIPVPGDYDGDGTTDMAVFRPSSGIWFVQGGATTAWGTSGDIPVPGDYDGDGTTDMAVFRPSSGIWFVQGGATTVWGADGDIPVPRDYDGDATTDIAVFRPSAGVWYVEGGPTTAWGTDGDVPVPGDYDGDATTDIAVFRPAAGIWFVQGGPTTVWGTAGDIALPQPLILPI